MTTSCESCRSAKTKFGHITANVIRFKDGTRRNSDWINPTMFGDSRIAANCLRGWANVLWPDESTPTVQSEADDDDTLRVAVKDGNNIFRISIHQENVFLERT